jgi:hypothetical protein
MKTELQKRLWRRQYRQRNITKIKAYDKEYQRIRQIEHKERLAKQHHEYYLKHKSHLNELNREYRVSHKAERKLAYIARCRLDVKFRVLTYLRSRLNKVLKHNIKSKTTSQLIGCSMETLKAHLEKQFKPGMCWSNHGTGFNGKGMQQWHIDHIIPCCKFDLSNPKEQRKCFHYTNLQPLWAKENLQKARRKYR